MAGVRGAALAALLLLAGLQACSCSLVIEQSARKIDIATFVAQSQTRLTVRNDGSQPAATLFLCERSQMMDRVSFLEVGEDGSDAKLPQKVAAAGAVPGAPADVACREYRFPQPLQPRASSKLLVVSALTHVLRPEPAEIAQKDVQRAAFRFEAQLVSPYKVESQTLELLLGSQSSAPEFTKLQPVKRSGDKLTYGPYQGTAPFASEAITVHYENTHPFAQVTELEREIEVSHWGNVYFEERYNLRHAGAKVVGEWSRYDVSTRPELYARASIPALAAVLPPAAHSLYYRDSIGNISSSETRYGLERVTVNLQPRYPLFGGWSTTFLFGWSLPLAKTVTKNPKTGRMTLVTGIGPAIQGLVVDSLTVKVVLPEGATHPTVKADMPLASEPEVSLMYTYLDVVGRPVVVLRARNLVPGLSAPFAVEYTHSSVGLLQKPLLLVGFFGALFAAAILLSRLSSGSSAALAASRSAQALVKPHAS